jgi:hypothetical protein
MEQRDPNAKEGGRIRLISMVDDPNPVAPGTEGIIRLVDGMGVIHVNWDDGRTIGVIPGIDKYQLLDVGVDYGKDVYDKSTEMFDSLQEEITVPKSKGSMPKPTKLSSTATNSMKSQGIKTGQVTKNFKSANIKGVKTEADTSWDELVEDEIKGGKADKLTVKDLAKKHKVDVEVIKKEIIIGVKIEKEHVGNDVSKAKEIAMDHISEFSDYYSNKRYGVLASEKGLKKSEKKKGKTDHMTSTGSVGGASGMGYTSPMAWAAGGVLTKKTGVTSGPLKKENIFKKADIIREATITYNKITEATNTYNTDKTSGIEGLVFADLDHDGWFFDDMPFWKGGKIVDIMAKVKTNWKDDKFLDGTKPKTKSKSKSKNKLKKEDLMRMVKTRIVESKKITVDLEKGDDILTGKFKNHKDKVKKIGKDDKNQPTVNDKPMLKFRIPKLIPKKEIKEEEIEETTTGGSVWGSSGPPVGPAFAAKKGQWKMAKKPIWIGGTIVQQDTNEGMLNPVNEVNKVKYNPKGKVVTIKKKCTKFPYCSQGAIDNPLNLSNTVKGSGSYVEENRLSDETIKNIHEISKQTGKSFNEVYKIVKEQMKLR